MRAKRGFSLVEMVVIIAIISVVAGLLAPVAAVVINNRLRVATKENMEALEEAILQFHRDTGRFPVNNLNQGNLALLSDRPLTGAPQQIIDNWNGPYLQPNVDDNNPASNNVTNDEFGNPYVIRMILSSSEGGNGFQEQMEITSIGENGRNENGGGDDIVKTVNIVAQFKEISQKEMDTVNRAIELHEKSIDDSFPAITNPRTVVQFLQQQDLLPDNTPGVRFDLILSQDEWGDNYVVNNGRFFSRNMFPLKKN